MPLTGGAGVQPNHLLHQEAPSYRLKPTGYKLDSLIWLYKGSSLQNLEVEKDFKICPNIFLFALFRVVLLLFIYFRNSAGYL